jgi:hypothetical protein
MASNYTRNFGFRSEVNIRRNARSRAPRTGTPFRIGTAVVEDTANPGYLARPTAAAPPTPNSGIAIFEHIQARGIDPFLTTTQDDPFRDVPLGMYAQRIHGPGVKVWFRNTDDKALYDGRFQEGDVLVAPADLTGVDVNDFLTPAGDGTWAIGTAADGWLQVTFVNRTSRLVEASFTF